MPWHHGRCFTYGEEWIDVEKTRGKTKGANINEYFKNIYPFMNPGSHFETIRFVGYFMVRFYYYNNDVFVPPSSCRWWPRAGTDRTRPAGPPGSGTDGRLARTPLIISICLVVNSRNWPHIKLVWYPTLGLGRLPNIRKSRLLNIRPEKYLSVCSILIPSIRQ